MKSGPLRVLTISGSEDKFPWSEVAESSKSAAVTLGSLSKGKKEIETIGLLSFDGFREVETLVLLSNRAVTVVSLSETLKVRLSWILH